MTDISGKPWRANGLSPRQQFALDALRTYGWAQGDDRRKPYQMRYYRYWVNGLSVSPSLVEKLVAKGLVEPERRVAPGEHFPNGTTHTGFGPVYIVVPKELEDAQT